MPLLSEDEAAHRSEHALEVQLPFLQVLAPGFRFVPIAVGTRNFEVLSALGVVDRQRSWRKRKSAVLVIASSDMNHYESDSVTRVKDRRAIDQLLALDPRGLYDVVHEGNISMCGYGPAVVMLTAARKLGATQAETDSLCDVGRRLWRQGHGGRLRGNRSVVANHFRKTGFQPLSKGDCDPSPAGAGS